MNKSSTTINFFKTLAGSMFLLLFSALMIIGNGAKAQVVYTEGFEPAPNPNPSLSLPYGWIQGKWGPGTDADNYFDRMSAGLLPPASPHAGSALLRYNSFWTTSGEASFIASRPLDMRSIPAGGAAVNFWLYRDGASYQTNTDRIQVYVNTSPTPTGATLLTETVTSSTTLNRSCSLTPAPVTCNAWNQYFYNIPQAGFNSANVYFIIVATSAFGNDTYIDDISITTYPNAQNYTVNSAAAVNQNTSTTAKGATNQQIIGLKINVDGMTSPLVIDSILFNTNGSTNPTADIVNAKLWFSGGTNNFDPNFATQLGTYTNPGLVTNFYMIAAGAYYTGSPTFSGLQNGDNYFWLTYNINAAATSGDFVDAEILSFTYGNTTVVPSPSTITGSREIDVVYCVPSYSVGTSWAGYQTNDFVNSVTLVGDNVPPPGISNNQNTINAYAGPLCPAPFPRLCPFQSHLPDYELFNAVAGKTTSVTANGTTNYPVSLQVGTYGSGNAIAAWIDYNKDGTFNNWFYNIAITATGAAAANTIVLSGVALPPGLVVGMTVTHPSIPAGTTITAINSGTNTITLSANNSGAVSGAVTFDSPTGEKIAQSQSLSNLGTYSTTFKVPNTAIAGKTRMRVREVWISYNIDPCAAATYGEVEDYSVTIVPDCPGASGFTTWLGFTDDWTDPSNWCPAVPPMVPYALANVLLPGAPSSAGYTYIRPVIRSGVQARALKLRIQTNDTIFIDAPTGSSLTVSDSLRIQGSNSAIVINSELLGTATVLNGALTQPTVGPTATYLSNSLKSKSFLVYTQSELLGQGLIANDIITDIQLQLERKNNGSPYNNFTIKYYYTNTSFVFVPGNPALTVPPQVTAPVTIRAAAPLSVTSIPNNTLGWITVPLTTPFTWTGGTNKLVIEVSYENAVGTGTSDQPRYTQTTGFRHYLTLIAAGATTTYPANTFLPPTTQTATAVGGSTTVTVTSSANLAVGMLCGGTGFVNPTYITGIVNGTTITVSPATSAAVSGSHVFGGNVFASAVLDYRPNVAFKYNRPYAKFPITVGGSWLNNGVPAGFYPGISRVTFNGSGAQVIEGVDSTTFYDLTIANSGAGTVMLTADAGVTDSLVLTSGRIKLNLRKLTLTNQSPSALTYAAGYIQSETDILANNVAPYGRLRWTMGSTAGIRNIPFWSTFGAGVSIPMNYNLVSGTHDVTLATHRTATTNVNIPSSVTNINGYYGGTDNSFNMVDRYYMVDNTASTSPVADITFRYPVGERPQGGVTPSVKAQRWLSGTAAWEYPYITSQSFAAGGTSDAVTLTGFSAFTSNLWWAFVVETNPLPISLLDFSATPFKDKVKLSWTTASEINNSHFIVDRTINNTDFEFIGRVESHGPSTSIQEYQTWDFKPLEGIQYYYLHQYDKDGKVSNYGPVSATFSRDLFDIISTTVSSTDFGVTVVFNYNSNEPYSYKVMDVMGKVIVAKASNPAEPGANVIDIPANLSKGVYHIVLQNSEKTVSRKFFY
jgi:hypothetical protein